MNENLDEQLLISARVDINSPIPIRTQILRIAVYDEFKAYETYSKIIEKFGLVQPFVNIKESEAIHYSALIQLMQKYNIDVPFNNWATKVEIPNTLIECCEMGVAAEINNIAMYNNLLSYATDTDVRDVIFRLQAASYNNHLPAFRNCVLAHYNTSLNNGDFSQTNIMEKLGEYQVLLDDIMSGNIDESSISQIFSKLNMSMVSGAVFGGAIIALLNNYISKQNQEEE
ncbi:ferritin-like domain-containing protein [Aliarcobacter butzleri]|uniref:ferritin-like domain-containing protein n=1 Tax=Aliarcobacter butzleri TaxID=28197 RepID=UPI003B20DCC8